MASFAPGAVLDRAKAGIVRSGGASGVMALPASTLINRVIAHAFAASAVAFGATSVFAAFSDTATTRAPWWLALRLSLFAGLALGALTGAMIRHLRAGTVGVAVAFLAVLFAWPFTMPQISTVHTQTPWVWGLCNLATAAAAIGMPDVAAAGYVLVVSVAWTLIRMTPSGGRAGIGLALQDGGYTFILGLALLTVIISLQLAAERVDEIQRSAAARYLVITKEHETEKERAAVDALLHDSVMTTLLTAFRAKTMQDQALLTRMSRHSLDVIADYAASTHDTGDTVTAAQIRARFVRLQEEIVTPMELTVEGPDDHSIPAQVTDALFAATGQALINSVQHAGPDVSHRTVTATWTATSVQVVVADDGVGFNPDTPTGRLGVSGSIIGRLNAIGGTATIDSAPGHGTRITMTWTTPIDPPIASPTDAR